MRSLLEQAMLSKQAVAGLAVRGRVDLATYGAVLPVLRKALIDAVHQFDLKGVADSGLTVGPAPAGVVVAWDGAVTPVGAVHLEIEAGGSEAAGFAYTARAAVQVGATERTWADADGVGEQMAAWLASRVPGNKKDEGTMAMSMRALIEAAEASPVTGKAIDEVEVHEIDGADARRWDQSFSVGGHHYVYPKFFAEHVVGIERGIKGADRTATIIHEVVERLLMKFDGLEYLEAHALANAAEEAVRRRKGKDDGETIPAKAKGDQPIGDNK